MCALGVWSCAQAEDAEVRELTTARYQLTWNIQRHAAFHSPYASRNSLSGSGDSMYTLSATAHWGRRLWDGAELYVNPELAAGVPFTGNLVGLGGFTNGEITRASGDAPKPYLQRLFLRQTWGRGGGRERLEGDFNQLAGSVDRDRIVLTVGNFSILDMFDGNAYAKDPRTQFMNWGHWTHASWDYAADARGFGWGAVLEWHQGDVSVRVGRMTGPREPNGLEPDFRLNRHFGDQIEFEHRHHLGERAGAVRVLAYRNRAVLASFRDALAWHAAHPGDDPMVLAAVRQSLKTKQGLGVNLEQSLGPGVGVFFRAAASDGRTETYAFTEVDRSRAWGAVLKGGLWGRPDDSAGLAQSRNALSADRRGYLASGALSYFIGDGALRSRPEAVDELFYSVSVRTGVWVSADVQRIVNPAYNADRGPVRVMALRVHARF